jgi:hypothetical protein
MLLREKFFNRSESLVFHELQKIASDNELQAFAKPRLSDVLLKDRYLTSSEYSMYSQAHFDFLLTDKSHFPILAVEYDGPQHSEEIQENRDNIKNMFCLEAGLPLGRIGANYVIREYRGMTLLRWIVEVIELQKAFDDAQERGIVSWDEPFDPLMIAADGSDRKWPYWLSVRETIQVNEFLDEDLDNRSWTGLHGKGENGDILWLEYLTTESGVLCARCRFREQSAPFPFWDLMSEVGKFEIGRKLLAHKQGKLGLVQHDEFARTMNRLNKEYDLRSGHFAGKTRSTTGAAV